MRMFVAAFAATLSLALLQVSPAPAQSAVDGARETLAETAPKSRAERLDALFDTLAAVENQEAAKAAEREILRVWLQSGSDTVDLLMDWTMTAMDEEDYPLALDFLDRIITLEPGYVEGWNRRATIHFLNDDYAKSIADIEQVLAIEPRHFGALAGLGTILRELGDERLALDAYRQALALDPVMGEVQKAIDELEATSGGRGI
jgi:tetratricopeptide (TPR) repeat protein